MTDFIRPASAATVSVCLAATVALVWHGAAQGVPLLPLGMPTATLKAEFTSVAAVRELTDGRVLVTDAGEKRLYVADWRSGAVTALGREGSGPGEYQRPRNLFALSADSTLLVDALGGRWLLLAGDSIVTTVPVSAPPIQAGARLPLGADAQGHVVASRGIGVPSGSAPMTMPRRDSSYLVRVHRLSGASDTIATLASRPGRISVSGPIDRATAIEIVVNPLSVGDQVVVLPDGWVAVVRVDPYRVDWIGPDGRKAQGAPLPFDRHPVTDREKRAILQRQATERGDEPRDPDSVLDWPATLPPFLTGAVLPASDGRIWIRRTSRAGDRQVLYDVVGRSGALSARLSLPDGQHVVGIGRAAVYTAETDADGIQRLRRHALPAIRSN